MCKIKNLPIKVIDPRCREVIYLLNKYGFKTKYCCSGHYNDISNFYIMFDDNLLDEQIDKLLMAVNEEGAFNKWKRVVRQYGKPVILTNWVYEINTGNLQKNWFWAKVFTTYLKKYYEPKKIKNRDRYYLSYKSEGIKIELRSRMDG